ncbi:uncharacterized protein LOC143853483 isoform X2 [Tasmannia lanceolata]|uniref:uncharacterized protein LOC143853483 isoform X2 n=1 Tax=Tasmannia lanceolata TaxID=3420 RepID=UPI004064AD9B
MEEVNGAEKSPKRALREKKRLHWKPVTAGNRKESTKEWVIRTFYSKKYTADSNTNTNNLNFFSASEHQQITSFNDPVAKHISSLANNTHCSTNRPILKTHQSNWRYGCQKKMEDRRNVAAHIPKVVSPLTNDPKPSVNRPRFSYAEALRNQSNGYQKTTEQQMNEPHNSPKVSVYRGNPRFGGTFTSSSIMNEMFLQRMQENNHFTSSFSKQTLNEINKIDLLEKEAEQGLEIETENFVLDEESHHVGNFTLEEVIEENGFRSNHQDGQYQQPQQLVQDFAQMLEMNEEIISIQGQRAPPARKKFLAIKPIFFWRKKTKSTPQVDVFPENYGYFGPKRYKYSDIETMTSSFSHKIGDGGFGSVFRGVLHDESLVAVKVLRDSKNGENEFITEVASIGKTSHVNIIRLLGFCSEGPSRALVYEFMPNRSLDKLIYNRELRHILGWRKPFEVAVGIARGLEYLQPWVQH